MDIRHSLLRRVLPLLALATLAVGLTACGGSTEVTDACMPGWYEDLPDDPNYVFSAQSATSQRMQVAVDKATTSGRAELASNLESEVQQMTQSFVEELNDEMRQQFEQTEQTVTSQVLQGTSAAEREICRKDNGTYQAYVLMEMPIGEAADQLMSKVQQRDEELYTRFRSHEAFKEMRKLVEEYEQAKENGRLRSQRESSSESSDEGGQ